MTRTDTIVLAIACVCLTAAAQIVLKTGVSAPRLQAALAPGSTGEFLMKAVLSPLVLLGLALYALSAVAWLLVLARADVSYAYPFVSIAYVILAAYGYFVLGEPIGTYKLVGLCLIVCGVWLVASAR